MSNAAKYTQVIFPPFDKRFDKNIRQWQGCPTIAITKGGRIYAGWYTGGSREPHIDNYNMLIYSDDYGKTWSEPILVIPGSHEHLTQSLDIQLWTAPDGRLFVFWVQNNLEEAGIGKAGYYSDGYMFLDKTHAQWMMVCDNPDSHNPEFSEPRCIDKGFLRCKPLCTQNGRWILFNYSQDSNQYEYSISDDCGKTFTRYKGAQKIATPFDESMAYQLQDGSIKMYARTYIGELAESTSTDDGITWSCTVPSGIDSPNTRFYVSKTPSGNVLLVNNDHRYDRTNMTIYLSEDEGKTWKYKRCIDTSDNISYPDVDFYNGRIYLIYDKGRLPDGEILFLTFTEDDIKNPDYTFEINCISRVNQ